MESGDGLPKIDIPIKRLVARRSTDWLRFICPEADPAKTRPFKAEKTPKVQSRLDEVFIVDGPEGQYIIHFEAQGYHDRAFPARMLRYRADIWESTMSAGQGAPHIEQTAVFFFPDHENKPHGLQDDGIDYKYRVVRLWEVPRAAVIDKSLIGLYPLLPLMQDEAGETPDAVLEQAVAKIAGATEDMALQHDLMAVLGIMGGEKYGAELVQRYIRREMLMQSQVYQEWIKEDIREAEAKERAKTLREDILEVLFERFDVVKKSLMEKINAIDDVSVLKALLKKSAKADSIEEFERFLDGVV